MRLTSRTLSSAALLLALGGCSGGDGPSGPPGGTSSQPDLRVEVAYLTQATQNRAGAVPLVAGRAAWLRVFATADRANNARPRVRVRLYQGASLLDTRVIEPDAPGVPTAVDQSSLANSWDLFLPGSSIVPGLRLLVDVDPDNGVAESNEGNNTFPASGTPQALEVTALPTLKLRFVPIHQRANGLVGRISDANRDAFMAMVRKLHPVADYDTDLHAPYTVEGLGLDPQGNSWQSLVAELDAVRVAEGSDRYYYGVVQTEYPGGGVVGIAAGIPSRTALGWDRPDDAPATLAHELGHNLGRYHAPCGGAGGADPNYPYTLGQIGVYGMDIETGQVKAPAAHTDIMGYCDAAFWISDYTYTGIYRYRATQPALRGAVMPSLLVWGRIENGRPVLEPAFQLDAPAALPARGGPWTVEGLAADGSTLFRLAFTPQTVPDVPGAQANFAFAVPLAPADAARLATLRLSGHGRGSELRSAAVSSAARAARSPARPVLAREGGELALRWDAAPGGAALVRDASSGQVLGIGRAGRMHLSAAPGHTLEVVVSDGVQSTRTRVGAP